MADIAEATDPEAFVELATWVRWLGGLFGLVAGAFGGLAVFRTTNGAGASTLIVVAVAFLLMAAHL